MTKAADKPIDKPAEKAVENVEAEKPAPPPKTPQQKRIEAFCKWVSFTKGVFHAAFTFAVYLAWAEVVSHLLPPTSPHELFACLVLVVMAFTGWVSGIDIISAYLEPWNLAEHPRIKRALSVKSAKKEQENT